MRLKTVLCLLLSAFCLAFSVQAQLGEKNRVKINRGSRYTRTNVVSLSIAAFEQTHMQIKNRSDFNDTDIWIPYQPKVYGWQLGLKEGKQEVFVRFKNKAGKITGPISDDIELDMTVPARPTIKIESETKAIGSPDQTVTLTISTPSLEDARYMMVSNSRTFFRKRWQILRESIADWKLSGSLDGKRAVFIKIRDKAGNVSEVAADEITVDSFAPVRATVVIDGGREFTSIPNGTVRLNLFAVGATEMLIADNEDFEGAEWKPFQKVVEDFKVDIKSGNLTVYVKYRDEAHNVSEVVKDEIAVDALPPQNGSILINAGDEISRQLDGYVELSISAEDAVLMMISEDKNFRNARWQAYNELITNWRLGGANGEKRVYIKFKDDAGNVSETYSDSILLIR